MCFLAMCLQIGSTLVATLLDGLCYGQYLSVRDVSKVNLASLSLPRWVDCDISSRDSYSPSNASVKRCFAARQVAQHATRQSRPDTIPA